ncbi:helix-turn-helix domain-containing protein [Agreia sp. PsM10]|uniref:PucR family transcriptional regulator n=1 Tax=Agreia sp. PsM10 TaxID=3030533 RepID=UPI00263BE2B5|nr:helix-turn-helix domain-containing protein [Agreia sp. PsM10]MDN4640061.1 helix-turn-helix domain-containing protein [Agreia sp. PsM10]
MMGYQELVDGIYKAFETPVTLSDAHERLIAFSAQPTRLTDSVRRETVLAREAGTGSQLVNVLAHKHAAITRFIPPAGSNMLERLIVPLAVPSGVVGYLYLIDPDHRVDDHALDGFRDEFDEVALQLELELFSRPQIEDSVRILLASGSADKRRRAATHIGNKFGKRFDGDVRAVAVERKSGVYVSPWIRELGYRNPWATVEQSVIFIMPSEDDSIAALERRGRSIGAGQRAAVGRKVAQLTDISRSSTDAIRALRLARDPAFLPATNPLVWDELGPWRMLLAIDQTEGAELTDARVARLIANQDEQTLRMIRMHLEPGKGSDDVANEFHMHRTTLYSRLRKIQVEFKLDWEDPDDRLSTVLGLRLASLSGVTVAAD